MILEGLGMNKGNFSQIRSEIKKDSIISTLVQKCDPREFDGKNETKKPARNAQQSNAA